MSRNDLLSAATATFGWLASDSKLSLHLRMKRGSDIEVAQLTDLRERERLFFQVLVDLLFDGSSDILGAYAPEDLIVLRVCDIDERHVKRLNV
jgi:hypothetical protein